MCSSIVGYDLLSGGDNVSRGGRGPVRAALGGRPGMKWITHIIAQRETKERWEGRLVSVTDTQEDKVDPIEEDCWAF